MSHLPAWIAQHLVAVRAIIVMTVMAGAIYPLAVLGIGQAALGHQANGSLVSVNGTVTGSSLLCQEFVNARGKPLPQYFQPRPSAATSGAKNDYGCDPLHSGASNLGPDNQALLQQVDSRKAAYAKLNGVSPASVPPDAVTASGSGLDPYISPRNAADQVSRVAAARRLPTAEVRALVRKYTQGRVIGFLGEPRVNVLLLNIALNRLG